MEIPCGISEVPYEFSPKFRVVGDPGIEPGVRLREGVTVPCHTLRPVALRYVNISNERLNRRSKHVRQHQKTTK